MLAVHADGRFAPSPTGPLHMGSLRTALAAWLFARSGRGRFLVRVEDLDPQRSRPECEREQLKDLQMLGLHWDGEVVRQSERTRLYAAALAELEAGGRLYPCFCTRAEVREAASAPHGSLPRAGLGLDGSMPRAGLGLDWSMPEGAYPGTCLKLSRAEREERLRAGRRAALRLRAGGERVSFRDLLLGELSGVVDDFVVRRADGVVAYQLAVVVDDAAQGVGQVVRGADLAESTPRQILLGRLLGLPTPAYAHLGLVVGPDGRRLAKRRGAATLADRREARERTLATLAHTLGLARDRQEVGDPAELLAEFDAERLPRGPVAVTEAT